MARFYGKIGYAIPVQTKAGVWEDVITERECSGNIVRNTSRWTQSSDSTNDNLNIDNQISIIADPFVCQNVRTMKYIEFMGSKWKISRFEFSNRRLILTVGDIYNE